MAAQTPLSTPSSSANTPGPKKRRNAGAMPSLPKPKKQKLPRLLDSITARNQLPNVPSSGGVNKAGQRMVKGPYKKREKKDKDGKKVNAGATGNNAPGTSGSTVGSGAGGKKAKSATGKSTSASTASAASGDPSSSRFDSMASHTLKDEDKDDTEGRKVGGADASRTNENGEPGTEGKEDDEDEQEEEPEYTEYEWNQEASSRGRSKDELKALLDSFSEEQLQRYEVYRRSVLSRPTVKKLVGTILNQQVTQTMAFVVAGFCKVFVGEMVEKAREVMDDWGETGAIRPEHLREAQRRYKIEEVQRGRGVQTPYGYKRRMFCK